MGLLGNLFGGREDHPLLPRDNYAHQRLREIDQELRKLAEDTDDRLEVVPSEHAAYVFVGKPPKKFGMAWVHDGKVTNLGALAQERKLNPIKLERIDDALREAYRASEDVERFAYPIDDHELVVTPSKELESRVHDILEELLH